MLIFSFCKLWWIVKWNQCNVSIHTTSFASVPKSFLWQMQEKYLVNSNKFSHFISQSLLQSTSSWCASNYTLQLNLNQCIICHMFIRTIPLVKVFIDTSNNFFTPIFSQLHSLSILLIPTIQVIQIYSSLLFLPIQTYKRLDFMSIH